jgi:hypothetical protein
VILRQFLTDPARVTVTVQDGIVTLEGKPETAPPGHDIVGQIRHVQGVAGPPGERAAPEMGDSP